MTYTIEDFDRGVQAWEAAAEAFKRRDVEGVTNELSPPLPNKESYHRTITMGVIGAGLCAQEIARQSGYKLGSLGVAYDLIALSPEAWEDRNEVCAAQAVSAAANADFHMVADLLVAHIPPDGVEECGVLLNLLSIYVDLLATGRTT